jgi:glycosyltransferase involved in cell wall biosynthesis
MMVETSSSFDSTSGAAPFVSVIIPVLNGERYIATCLDSVIQQSYSNLEILVANNLSTDHTLDIVNSYGDPRIRVLPDPKHQLRLHDNWTRAMIEANGEFVKIVCHDDLLLDGCISAQVDLLQRYEEAVLTCSRRRIIDDRGKLLIRARGLGHLVRHDDVALLNGRTIAHECTRAGSNLLGEPASVLIRRTALPEVPFDYRWTFALDIEFYMRCIGQKDAVVDGRVLSCFRVSPRQLSASLASRQAEEMKVFFTEMALRYPGDISRTDLQIGKMKSKLLVQARRLLYLYLRFRDAMTARRQPHPDQS